MKNRNFITAMALGAGAVYFLDKEHGAERRHELQERAASAGRRVTKTMDKSWLGLMHRLAGDSVRMDRPEENQTAAWTPASRFLGGLTGGYFLLKGLRWGGFTGWAVGLAGGGLLTRSLVNRPARDLEQAL